MKQIRQIDRTLTKDLIRYVSLNVLGMVGLSCYILADTFFVSRRLGADGLAALNLALPLYNFLNGTGLMIGMGGGTKFAIEKSQHKDEACDVTFTHAVWLAMVAAIFFCLLGLFFAGSIVHLMGTEGRVYEMSQTYLRVILLFAPAFLFNQVFICFVRNDGNPQLAMAAMLCGSLFNVVFDWVFMFPLDMGIFGAVLATGVSPVVSIAILFCHLKKRDRGFHLKKIRWSVNPIRTILASGVPSLVTEVASGVVMIVFNGLLLALAGNTAVAAYGVIANLSQVVLAVDTGIAQGCQPLFSRCFGQGQAGKMVFLRRAGLLTAVVFSMAVYAVFFFGTEPVVALFNSTADPQLQQIAEMGMKIYFLGMPFAGFSIVLAMFFTSTERPRPAQWLCLLRGMILIVPMALLLSSAFGQRGVFAAFPATEILTAILGASILSLEGKRKQGRERQKADR